MWHAPVTMARANGRHPMIFFSSSINLATSLFNLAI
jgi:hypothetical protein